MNVCVTFEFKQIHVQFKFSFNNIISLIHQSKSDIMFSECFQHFYKQKQLGNIMIILKCYTFVI